MLGNQGSRDMAPGGNMGQMGTDHSGVHRNSGEMDSVGAGGSSAAAAAGDQRNLGLGG